MKKTVMKNLNTLFRGLRYGNFRLFFISQCISLTGTWMQQVAVSWLVYRISGSAFLLGAVNVATMLPTLFLSPFAGVLIDRWNRRKMIFTTQTFFMLQAFIFTLLILTDRITIGWIFGLSVFYGVLCAFDIPGRQSFLIEMVDDKEDLGNVIALNSIMFNVTRMLGPAIAGLLIKFGGEKTCFTLNTFSYLAPLVVLYRMKIANRHNQPDASPLLRGMKEGLEYLKKEKLLLSVLSLLAVISFAGMPFSVLMPIFAKDILHGGPDTLGFLMASAGVGALTGAVYLAGRHAVQSLAKAIPSAALLFGISLLFFSLSRSMGLSVILMFFAGFGSMIQMNATNIILQTQAGDRMRGRMMSFYTMAFMGLTPFGAFLAGWAASKFGATLTVSAGALTCITGTFWVKAGIEKHTQGRPSG